MGDEPVPSSAPCGENYDRGWASYEQADLKPAVRCLPERKRLQ